MDGYIIMTQTPPPVFREKKISIGSRLNTDRTRKTFRAEKKVHISFFLWSIKKMPFSFDSCVSCASAQIERGALAAFSGSAGDKLGTALPYSAAGLPKRKARKS